MIDIFSLNSPIDPALGEQNPSQSLNAQNSKGGAYCRGLERYYQRRARPEALLYIVSSSLPRSSYRPWLHPDTMQEEEVAYGSASSGTPATAVETSETPSLQETQKGLMSPPTPAPSPTPGRHGYWGTVGRGEHEDSHGERRTRAKGKGKAKEGDEESSDEMEGIVSGSYGASRCEIG